jgi:hypothetical protein
MELYRRHDDGRAVLRRRLRAGSLGLAALGLAGAIAMFFGLPFPRGHGDHPFPTWTYPVGYGICAALVLAVVLAAAAFVAGGKRGV